MPYANNKGADQPAYPCSLISTFVVRSLDSIISLASIFYNCMTLALSVAEQAGLSRTWSQTPEDRFSHDVAHTIKIITLLELSYKIILANQFQVREPRNFKPTRNEPPHDKINKMTVHPAKTDQPGHLPSLIRVFDMRSMGSKGLKLSSCGQRRLWSDWADVQADLSLHWVHMPFCWFLSCSGSNVVWHILWPNNENLRTDLTFIIHYAGHELHMPTNHTHQKKSYMPCLTLI